MAAYNQHGEGHFDGVVPMHELVVSTDTAVNIVSCTCEKNDKTDTKHCCGIKYLECPWCLWCPWCPTVSYGVLVNNQMSRSFKTSKVL